MVVGGCGSLLLMREKDLALYKGNFVSMDGEPEDKAGGRAPTVACHKL